MDAFTMFEVEAETFRLMTGHMAPGKDVAAGACEADYDERVSAFNKWYSEHSECVNAMLKAMEGFID